MSMLVRIDSQNNQAGRGEICFDLNAPPAQAEGVRAEGIVQEVCTRVDVQIDHEDAFRRYVGKCICWQGHETICERSMF
jgi:hypothetical protein